MTEITISYEGQDYTVPLTADPGEFYVHSGTGATASVTAATEASLFGAEQAVMKLQQLNGSTSGVNQTIPTWDADVKSAAVEVGQQDLANLLAGFSGALIVGALSLPEDATASALVPAVGPAAIKALGSALLGAAPGLADLAAVSELGDNAADMLSKAVSTYYSSIDAASSPIPFTTIEGAVNDTLTALAVFESATIALHNIPGLNSSWFDRIIGIGSSFLAPFDALANAVKSAFVSALGSAGSEVQDILDTAGKEIDIATQVTDQGSFAADFASALGQLIGGAEYGPLTYSGLATAAADFAGTAAPPKATSDVVWSITPPAGEITEKSGTVTFTVSRSDASGPATVWISTTYDLGTENPNQDYYYKGILDYALQFNAGQASLPVTLTVNDLGLTTGSESFGLIAQSNQNDLPGTYLARTTFTINNTDTLPGTFTITPDPLSVSESAGVVWLTITRSDITRQATVYVSTVHNNQSYGNPNGDYYYQGLLNDPVTFGIGQSQALVALTINDLGLTSGSEQFEVIVQQDPDDPITQTLASTPFTIENTDGNGSTGGGGTTVAAGSLNVQEEPLSVQEDATATITPALLDTTDSAYSDPSKLTYVVVTPPSYGSLLNHGTALASGGMFTQADINADALQYRGSDGGTSQDGFTFQAFDPGGNNSGLIPFTINVSQPPPQSPPPAPVVTIQLVDDTGLSPTDGVTSDPDLTGTADPGATVELTENGTVSLGSVVANSTGIWTYDGSGLAQGYHRIIASERNAAGLTGSSYLTFWYSSVVPEAPSEPTLSGGGTVSAVATPTFSGTNGGYVELLEDNTVLGTGLGTGSKESWFITAPPLAARAHTVTAISIDAAGETSTASTPLTFTIAPPPRGQVVLNDASMVDAGDLVKIGEVTDKYSNVLTEYGPISADGFTLTNTSRSQFAFLTWDAGWAFNHGSDEEYQTSEENYNGPDVLVIPTDGFLDSETGRNTPAATPDTIDLRRTDGSAFSLQSVDIAPTQGENNYPLVEFTGTMANGSTIAESVGVTWSSSSADNMPLAMIGLTGFGDVTNVEITTNKGNTGTNDSVEFDNFTMGNPETPVAPPESGPLSVCPGTY